MIEGQAYTAGAGNSAPPSSIAAPASMDMATGLFAAANVFQTISGIYSSISAAQENKAQARFNAAMNRIRARDALFRGQIAEQEYRKQGAQLKGEQRAVLSAQSIALDSGTALELQTQAASAVETNALTIRSNAMREAWGMEMEASAHEAEGRRAEYAGRAGAAESIVGGATRGAALAYDVQRQKERKT